MLVLSKLMHDSASSLGKLPISLYQMVTVFSRMNLSPLGCLSNDI